MKANSANEKITNPSIACHQVQVYIIKSVQRKQIQLKKLQDEDTVQEWLE